MVLYHNHRFNCAPRGITHGVIQCGRQIGISMSKGFPEGHDIHDFCRLPGKLPEIGMKSFAHRNGTRINLHVLDQGLHTLFDIEYIDMISLYSCS